MTKEQIVALLKDDELAYNLAHDEHPTDLVWAGCPECASQLGGIKTYRAEILRRIEKEG